ncbi:hypothetical protein NHH03_09045 [Stieleria sp. TO1_6]|uniref:hypothetical protein n=1 Tax=Stieleria tagensis TaxID=2956795 RepID=UPI00209B8DFB|nr:hypothetical protein [Stieleria tagensis]MCO8121880.1 hypothetical protein [Stieleria tagensis]
MTLRSRKKRPTTAPTSNQRTRRASTGHRQRALVIALAITSCGSLASFATTALAQPPGASSAPATTTPGWNLRWRRSPKLTPDPVHVPRSDVFATPPRQTDAVAQVGYQDNGQRQPVAAAVNQNERVSRNAFEQAAVARQIRQMAHNESIAATANNGQPIGNYSRQPAPIATAQPAPSQTTPSQSAATIHRSLAEPSDFFRNPFAEAPQPITRTLAPPAQQQQQRSLPRPAQHLTQTRAAANRTQSGMQLPAPTESPDNTASPAGDLPANDLRGSALQIPAPPATTDPAPAADQTPLPQPTLPQPTLPQPTAPPTEDDTSMRDLLADPNQQITPDQSDAARPDAAGRSAAPKPDAPKPSAGDDRTTDSPSDKAGMDQYLYQNPFDEERGGSDRKPPKPKELTCEEFRSRIAHETIDRISLDPSPPFRPDLIDPKAYREKRKQFESQQPSRDWSDIDGRVVAKGRLVDLAYDQVIVQTESGARAQVPMNELSEGDWGYLSENWGLPKYCLIEQVAHTPRAWDPLTMTWKASNACSKTRYFEEVNLERYGHTAGPLLQPVVSSAHFFANIAVLPYKMGIHPPTECQYALGYYRPGNCAPWIIPPVPISARGALTQAAAMTGAFWLIP